MAKEIRTTDVELMAVIGAAADEVVYEKYGDITGGKADEAIEVAAMISHKTISHLTGVKKLKQENIDLLMSMEAVRKLIFKLLFGGGSGSSGSVEEE